MPIPCEAQMTNEELIEILKKFPKDAKITVFNNHWNEYEIVFECSVSYLEEDNEIQIG